jgi:hypothetical protein
MISRSARGDTVLDWIGLDTFLYLAAQNFELFKYSRSKLKNLNPIAVDVFFKAYPMVPFSCRSNLAGRYLYTVKLPASLLTSLPVLVDLFRLYVCCLSGTSLSYNFASIYFFFVKTSVFRLLEI